MLVFFFFRVRNTIPVHLFQPVARVQPGHGILGICSICCFHPEQQNNFFCCNESVDAGLVLSVAPDDGDLGEDGRDVMSPQEAAVAAILPGVSFASTGAVDCGTLAPVLSLTVPSYLVWRLTGV